MNKAASLVLCALVAAACAPANASAVPVPTRTATAIPATATPAPTATSTPTSTPDARATQQYSDFLAWVGKLVGEGILPDSSGRYVALADSSESLAHLHSFHVTPMNDQASDFVVQARVKMQNASKNSLKAACGFAFHIHGENSRAVFLAQDGNVMFLTNGYPAKSNYLDAALPSSPDGNILTLVAYNNDVRLYVNDRMALMINQVSRFDLPPTPGVAATEYLGPSVLSGTNDGFGTRCDFTNFQLLVIR